MKQTPPVLKVPAKKTKLKKECLKAETERKEDLKTRQNKPLEDKEFQEENPRTRTETKNLENKENSVAGYEEKRLEDSPVEEKIKFPSFKSNRLRRKRKLVNSTVSQVTTLHNKPRIKFHLHYFKYRPFN